MAYTQLPRTPPKPERKNNTIDCVLDGLVELALSLEFEKVLGLGTCTSRLERLDALCVDGTCIQSMASKKRDPKKESTEEEAHSQDYLSLLRQS